MNQCTPSLSVCALIKEQLLSLTSALWRAELTYTSLGTVFFLFAPESRKKKRKIRRKKTGEVVFVRIDSDEERQHLSTFLLSVIA